MSDILDNCTTAICLTATCENNTTLQLITFILTAFFIITSIIYKIFFIPTEAYLKLYTDSDQSMDRFKSTNFWKCQPQEYRENRDSVQRNEWIEPVDSPAKIRVFGLLLIYSISWLGFFFDLPYVMFNSDIMSFAGVDPSSRQNLNLSAFWYIWMIVSQTVGLIGIVLKCYYIKRKKTNHLDNYRMNPADFQEFRPEFHILDSNVDIVFRLFCITNTIFLEYFFIERSEEGETFFSSFYVASNNILSTVMLIQELVYALNIGYVLLSEVGKNMNAYKHGSQQKTSGPPKEKYFQLGVIWILTILGMILTFIAQILRIGALGKGLDALENINERTNCNNLSLKQVLFKDFSYPDSGVFWLLIISCLMSGYGVVSYTVFILPLIFRENDEKIIATSSDKAKYKGERDFLVNNSRNDIKMSSPQVLKNK